MKEDVVKFTELTKTEAETYNIAFNQGKIEGFNEGIEAAIRIMARRNLVDFKTPIDFKYEVIDEVKKLKKPI